MISAMKINIVLFQPEIPQNTGNISRTCSATGCVLHLVHPLGFSLDEKHLRRAGLDYWDGLEIHEYNDNDDFFAQHSSKKLWFFSQKGHHNLWEGPMRRILLCFLFLLRIFFSSLYNCLLIIYRCIDKLTYICIPMISYLLPNRCYSTFLYL